MANYSPSDSQERLRAALPEHYSQLDEARSARTELIEIYAGTCYPDLYPETGLHDPVNYLRDFADAQTLSISANRPRFLATSLDPGSTGFAAHLQRTLDTYARQIGLEKTLQDFALDGFFGLGVIKVCLHEWSWNESGPLDYATFGFPNVVRVPFDHFCYDTDASDFEFCSFMADRYQRPFYEVINNEHYNKEVREQLRRVGPAEFEPSAEWAENIARSGSTLPTHVPKVYIADCYSSEDRTICKYVVDREFNVVIDEPLKKIRWTGKPQGPYTVLNMGRVPDNTKAASPGQKILKLHEMGNFMWRKLRDQSARQKNVGVAPGNDEKEIARFRDATDGDWVYSGNPQQTKVERFDGPDQALFALLMQVENRINQSGGNYVSKLGQAAQAETLGQEKLIANSISRVDAAYASRFVQAVRAMAKDLAKLIYEDAALSVRQTLTLPNISPEFGPLNDDWLPRSQQQRPIPYEQLSIDIDPYSLPYQSPGERAARLRQDLQLFLPAAEFLSQQGVQLDLAATLEELANLENRPELRKMFRYDQPITPAGPSDPHRRSLPTATNREYLHRNQSEGVSAENQPMQMMMALAGANQNGK